MALANDLHLNIDKGYASLLPLLDLPAVFDAVAHAILWRHLQADNRSQRMYSGVVQITPQTRFQGLPLKASCHQRDISPVGLHRCNPIIRTYARILGPVAGLLMAV